MSQQPRPFFMLSKGLEEDEQNTFNFSADHGDKYYLLLADRDTKTNGKHGGRRQRESERWWAFGG